MCQRFGQGLGAFFAGQVGGQAMAFAEGRQFGGGLAAGLGIAGTDEDPRAGFQEALGDHSADATGATGNQGGAALEAEVGVHCDPRELSLGRPIP
ncbi:hypothetical protein D9M69_639290 [compost metagenome]